MDLNQNNKSSLGIIFLVVFIIIVIIGTVLGGYYYFKHKETLAQQQDSNKVSFFVKPKDYNSGNDIMLNYEIFEAQNVIECLNDNLFELYTEDQDEFYNVMPHLRGTFIDDKGCYIKKQIFYKVDNGVLYQGLNFITINGEVPNLFYYYSDDYYVNQEAWLTGFMSNVNLSKNPDDISRKSPENRSVTAIYAHKKSKLVNISLLGEFNKSNSNSIMRVVLQGENKQFRHTNLCFEYSTNIVKIVGNYEEIENPKRFSYANRCYKLGESLSSSNNFYLQRDFNITTLQLDYTDYINIYAFDEDLIYNGEEWNWATEDGNGINIGAADFNAKIKVYK